jgi:hypothetical protein
MERHRERERERERESNSNHQSSTPIEHLPNAEKSFCHVINSEEKGDLTLG